MTATGLQVKVDNPSPRGNRHSAETRSIFSLVVPIVESVLYGLSDPIYKRIICFVGQFKLWFENNNNEALCNCRQFHCPAVGINYF